MYVITQKEDNYIVGICTNIIDNNDGSFLDCDEDVIYYKCEFTYYPNVEVPGGIHKGQYSYTPEDGFKLEFNKLDMLKLRLANVSKERELNRSANHVSKLYANFRSEKQSLEENISLITDEVFTNNMTLEDIQIALCDIYELLLGEEGE